VRCFGSHLHKRARAKQLCAILGRNTARVQHLQQLAQRSLQPAALGRRLVRAGAVHAPGRSSQRVCAPAGQRQARARQRDEGGRERGSSCAQRRLAAAGGQQVALVQLRRREAAVAQALERVVGAV
jgi:hypothetical protein